MFFVILLPTIIFLFYSFLGSTSLHISNPLVSYMFYQLDFILQNFLLLLVGFCGLIFFFIRQQHHEKKHIFSRNYSRACVQSLVVVITSIFTAFILLFVVAWVELNCFAALININPSLLGITGDTKTIVKMLQKNSTPPIIVASEKTSQKEVVAIATATVGKSNFYGENILSAIPSFLILPLKKTPSSLVLIDNVLIITSVNIQDMQAVSPVLGHLFVQSYFPNRVIKAYPKISVMDNKQFLSFRKSDAQQKLTSVTEEIKKLEESISSISATIKKDTDAVAANVTTQDASLKQQNTDYDKCLSVGTYTEGKFVPEFSKDYCQAILDQWDNKIVSQAKTADVLKQQLQRDQQQLEEYKYFDNFFTAQKTLMSITTGNIPYELGVFIKPDTLKIVVDSTNSKQVADYFETLSHEYLHYASYVADKRLDSSFFEEGLTEYFARNTIKDLLQIDTNIGYPVAVKIIEALTKRIAEPDLADIYFTKDEVALEHRLDLVYGDNFYKNNFVLFESLQFTSDPSQELQLANTLMKKIGGNPLTIKDLYSSQSSL